MGKATNMNFSEALDALKGGGVVTREGWNARGLAIFLQRPDEHSKMTVPYLYMLIQQGASGHLGPDKPFGRVPWLPSQADLMAEDWCYIVMDETGTLF